MKAEETVFVGVPTYDDWMCTGCMCGLLHASKTKPLIVKVIASSALPFAFNQLWVSAVQSKAKYWAMCHADVGPDAYWVDTMIDEMEQHDADILSAVIPIKDASNVYSVAMCHDGKPAHYRLTVDHAGQLPVTFGTEDMQRVTGEGGLLCANTGLWVCRLDRPWVKQVSFQFLTGIDWSGDKPRCEFIPEDWDLSQQLHRGGYKVMCTQKVRVTHAGQHVWQSRPAG